MSVLRHGQRERFTTVSNDTIEDPRLSFKALGLLMFLLSRPDGWHVDYRHLAGTHADGEYATRMALRELEEAGYLHRAKERSPNGQYEAVSIIFERPQPSLPQPPTAAVIAARETADARTAAIEKTEVASTKRPKEASSNDDALNLGLENTHDAREPDPKHEKPPSLLGQHTQTLTKLAFEREDKPTIASGANAFPAVRGIIGSALRAGWSVADVEAVVTGPERVVWTLKGLIAALEHRRADTLPSLAPKDRPFPIAERMKLPATHRDHPDYGFEKWWETYPARDGLRLGRERAVTMWRAMPYDTKAAAYRAAANYAQACAEGLTIPKDPDHWLKDRCWTDWQEPAVAQARAAPGHSPREDRMRTAAERFLQRHAHEG